MDAPTCLRLRYSYKKLKSIAMQKCDVHWLGGRACFHSTLSFQLKTRKNMRLLEHAAKRLFPNSNNHKKSCKHLLVTASA